jgi:hypothetical protein
MGYASETMRRLNGNMLYGKKVKYNTLPHSCFREKVDPLPNREYVLHFGCQFTRCMSCPNILSKRTTYIGYSVCKKCNEYPIIIPTCKFKYSNGSRCTTPYYHRHCYVCDRICEADSESEGYCIKHN